MSFRNSLILAFTGVGIVRGVSVPTHRAIPRERPKENTEE